MYKGVKKFLIGILCVLLLFSAFSFSACTEGYSIKFDCKGGFFPSDQTVPERFTDSDANIVLPVPKRYGYKFVGWTWDGQPEPLTDAVFSAAEYKSSVTFTAWWSEEQDYTVKFNLNYNYKCTFNNKESVADVTVKYSATISWLKNAVPKGEENKSETDKNYRFAGWYYVTKEGRKIKITSSTLFTENTFGDERVITINAVCEKLWTDPY